MRKIIEILISWSLLIMVIFIVVSILITAGNKLSFKGEYKVDCLEVMSEAYDEGTYKTASISSRELYIYINRSSNENWIILISYDLLDLNKTLMGEYTLIKTYKLYPKGLLACYVKEGD